MSLEHALARARHRDQRIGGLAPPLRNETRGLHDELQGALLAAVRSERLLSSAHDVNRLFQRIGNPFSGRGSFDGVVGGRRDFHRSSEDRWFQRDDGGRFNFFVTVTTSSPLRLIAYNFELRLPAARDDWFVRFDLNPNWITNRTEPRCHVHLGHDDLRAPSPLLSPLELLELFLYDLRLPARHLPTR